MKLRTEDAIAQIDSVLASDDWRRGLGNVGQARWAALGAAGVAAIGRLTPPGSSYRVIADNVIQHLSAPGPVLQLKGALEALRSDYAAGYAASVEELVHADVFGDFIGMAQELLEKGYKDAAAVVVGSVLEGHLRQLAAKNGVQADDGAGKPKNADRLNADMVKAGVYGTLDQKQVMAWQGLRNHAAHGEYERYDAAQVGLMLQGVTDFLVRFPA